MDTSLTDSLVDLFVWPGFDASQRALAPSMIALSILEELGPQSITRLALASGSTQPAMTGLVQRLAEAGLVQRKRREDDGREVVVTISTAGRRKLRQYRRTIAEQVGHFVDTMAKRDRQKLEQAAPAIGSLVAAIRDDKRKAIGRE